MFDPARGDTVKGLLVDITFKRPRLVCDYLRQGLAKEGLKEVRTAVLSTWGNPFYAGRRVEYIKGEGKYFLDVIWTMGVLDKLRVSDLFFKYRRVLQVVVTRESAANSKKEYFFDWPLLVTEDLMPTLELEGVLKTIINDLRQAQTKG